MMVREFLVTISHDGPTVEAFDTTFEQYLTEPSHPFLTDYGPDAWGGYQGPFVHAITVEPKR